jgi:hypothetical protein
MDPYARAELATNENAVVKDKSWYIKYELPANEDTTVQLGIQYRSELAANSDSAELPAVYTSPIEMPLEVIRDKTTKKTATLLLHFCNLFSVSHRVCDFCWSLCPCRYRGVDGP